MQVPQVTSTQGLRFRITRLLVALWVGIGFTLTASAQDLGRSGNRFTVNNQPKFLVFISYFDYNDAPGNEYIADLDWMVQRGINGIRILPNWWSYQPGQSENHFAGDTLFMADGNINEGTWGNLVWYLDRARERGIIVDLTLSADTVSSCIECGAGAAADITFGEYLGAIQNLTARMAGSNFRHVLFDIQNESNLNGPDNDTPLSQGQIQQIVNAVHAIDPLRLVTASTDGGFDTVPTAQRAVGSGQDVIAWHEKRDDTWWVNTRNWLNQIRSVSPDKPIYLQEPQRYREGGPEDNGYNAHWFTWQGLTEAVREAKKGCAAAWTFHTVGGHYLNGTNLRDWRLRQMEKDWAYNFNAYLAGTEWCEGQPPPPPNFPPPGGPDTLTAGQVLYPNQMITAPATGRHLLYQTDGNLVAYTAQWQPTWAISCWPNCTPVGPPGYTTMQTDGNFVVYNQYGTPVFHTGTWGHPGAYAALRHDGNLMIIQGNTVLWSLF